MGSGVSREDFEAQKKEFQEEMKKAREADRAARAEDMKIFEEMMKNTSKKYEKQMQDLEKTTKRTELEELKTRLIQFQQMQKTNSRYAASLSRQLQTATEYYNKVNTKYEEEKKQVSEFSIEREDPKILRTILYSPTGHGKSTLANRIWGDKSPWGDKGPFIVSDSVDSTTKTIKKKVVDKLYNHAISIVDQPGVADSEGDLEDDKHANNLISYLRGIDFINAILLIKTMNPPRFDSGYQKMLRDLQRMLGKGMWKHAVIVFTGAESASFNASKIDEYTSKFTEKVRDQMRLSETEAPLPTIVLSNIENYEKPLQQLFNEIVPNLGALKCESLVSPLDVLREERDRVKKGVDEINEEINENKVYSDNVLKETVKTEEKIQRLQTD